MQLQDSLNKIETFVVKFITIIATSSITVTFVVMLVQVFLRRVFNRPIIWAEDLSVFLFIWITFLGAAILFQKKTLSSVNSLVMIFPMTVRTIISAFVDLIVFVASIYLLKLAIDFMKRQQLLGHKLGGALGIPIWIVTLAVISSFALILFFSIISLVQTLLTFKKTRGA